MKLFCRSLLSLAGRRAAGRGHEAFTLVEMLVVIAIMGILAALLVGALPAANRMKKRSQVKAQFKQIEAGIEQFKLTYGTYPPDNPNNTAQSSLFYELQGTIYNPATLTFSLPNNSETITSATASNYFGVGGFVNSSDDPKKVKPFVTFGTKDYAELSTSPDVEILVVPFDGPNDITNAAGKRLNPWRYNSSSPVNVPKKYDLWSEFLIGDQTNRINNWER